MTVTFQFLYPRVLLCQESQSRNGETLFIRHEGRRLLTLPRIDGNQATTIPTLKWKILSPVSRAKH